MHQVFLHLQDLLWALSWSMWLHFSTSRRTRRVSSRGSEVPSDQRVCRVCFGYVRRAGNRVSQSVAPLWGRTVATDESPVCSEPNAKETITFERKQTSQAGARAFFASIWLRAPYEDIWALPVDRGLGEGRSASVGHAVGSVLSGSTVGSASALYLARPVFCGCQGVGGSPDQRDVFYIYIYLSTSIYTYTHAYMYVQVYIYIYIYTYTCIYICR